MKRLFVGLALSALIGLSARSAPAPDPSAGERAAVVDEMNLMFQMMDLAGHCNKGSVYVRDGVLCVRGVVTSDYDLTDPFNSVYIDVVGGNPLAMIEILETIESQPVPVYFGLNCVGNCATILMATHNEKFAFSTARIAGLTPSPTAQQRLAEFRAACEALPNPSASCAALADRDETVAARLGALRSTHPSFARLEAHLEEAVHSEAASALAADDFGDAIAVPVEPEILRAAGANVIDLKALSDRARGLGIGLDELDLSQP